ncbi:MAG: DUF4139 domain-containing protein [Myxococcales bacterium]
MMLLLLAALAVKAAVSQVTIYGDRARVVRASDVEVSGRTRVELPLLPDTVDAQSIRVEAEGAEVQKVDIQHVQPDEFPVGEARQLLDKLDSVDDNLRKLADDRSELQQHLSSLRRIVPAVPSESLRPRPKLNAGGWAAALSFAQDEEQSLQARIRDAGLQMADLQRERQAVAERARIIGGAGRRSGLRVSAQLEGKGAAHLTLTYLVAQARWTPQYDLQLQHDQKTVRVSFSGAASQTTGEDWDGASLTLSTAIPATARALPEIFTWKIGEKERFIPTPYRADRPRPPPPPPAPPPPIAAPASESDRLRQDLMARVQSPPPVAAPSAPQAEEKEEELSEVAVPPMPESVRSEALALPAPPAMAPPPPRAERKRAGKPTAPVAVTAMPPPKSVGVAQAPSEQVGIAPPPSWQRPYTPPDSPAALAGGYDLEFPSVRRETVRTGGGARRVLLFSESWPVTTERLIYPALAPEAYLVAQIKNPTLRTLPRGQAALAVGADPAGTATVPLVAPGEEFTLPLGIDRALRTFRNIAQVQSEHGLFSKDEVTRYAVTIEVANPYTVAIPLRVVDQLPLQGDKNIEVSLIEAKGAEREEGTGRLTWRVNAPASGKVKLAFVYELKRPKGYKVHQ